MSPNRINVVNNNLNNASYQALNYFSEQSQKTAEQVKKYSNQVAESFLDSSTTLAGAQQGIKELVESKIINLKTLATSSLIKGFSLLGGVVDSITGVSSVADGVQKDIDTNNKLFSNSMFEIAGKTFQIGGGAIAANLAAVGLASIPAIATAPAWVPVMAVATAAIGSAWALGKAIDWIRPKN